MTWEVESSLYEGYGASICDLSRPRGKQTICQVRTYQDAVLIAEAVNALSAATAGPAIANLHRLDETENPPPLSVGESFPEGSDPLGGDWVLVPREPTEEMLEAADAPFHEEWRRQRERALRLHGKEAYGSGPFSEAIYRAMINASPPSLGGEEPKTEGKTG